MDLEVEAVVASTTYEAIQKKASSTSKLESIKKARSAFEDRLASLSLQRKEAEECRDGWTAALDNLKVEIEAAVVSAEAKTLAEPSYRYSASDTPSSTPQSERSGNPVAAHGRETDNASSLLEPKPRKGSTLKEAEPKANLGGDRETLSGHHGSASPMDNATTPVAVHAGEGVDTSSPPQPGPRKGSTQQEAVSPPPNPGDDTCTCTTHSSSSLPTKNDTTIPVATHGGERVNACSPPEPKSRKGFTQTEAAPPKAKQGGDKETSSLHRSASLKDNATMPVAVHGGEGVDNSSPPNPRPIQGPTTQEAVLPPADSGDASTSISQRPAHPNNNAIIQATGNIGCLLGTKPRKDSFRLEVHTPQETFRHSLKAFRKKLFFRSSFASAPTERIFTERSLCLLRLFLGSTWDRMSRGP